MTAAFNDRFSIFCDGKYRKVSSIKTEGAFIPRKYLEKFLLPLPLSVDNSDMHSRQSKGIATLLDPSAFLRSAIFVFRGLIQDCCIILPSNVSNEAVD